MIKLLKNSFACSVSIITVVFTFVPETSFENNIWLLNVCDEASVFLNRLLAFIIVLVFSIFINSLYLLFRRNVLIKGKNYIIKIEYGDLFKKKKCKKVITFDECFTTNVGNSPSDIKPNSICGQYLIKHPDLNMQELINDVKLKPAKSKSKCQNKERYESGKLVPNGDDLLMAFAKLDEDGLGRFFSRDEFINCLSILWKEIDKYYGQKDVCIPILGSGITRMNDNSLTQQELLDIIIESYKLSSNKIKRPYKLHIVCKSCDGFSLNRIGESL